MLTFLMWSHSIPYPPGYCSVTKAAQTYTGCNVDCVTELDLNEEFSFIVQCFSTACSRHKHMKIMKCPTKHELFTHWLQ